MPDEWTPPPTPEPDTEQQEVKGSRPVVPPRQPAPPPQPPPIPTPPASEPQGSASVQSVSAEVADASTSLPTLTFYPARLPAVVGKEGELTVVLDPSAFGVSAPLNFAYDPSRLEVRHVEGGELPGASGHVRVQVSHTPALGWIAVSWKDRAVGTGTLVRMIVKPREPGEIQIIFAGPIGAVVSKGATVVALPGAVGEVPQ